MLELTNICVKSPLPLHAYLLDNPEICVRTKSDQTALETTEFVRGDVASGIWECDGSLQVPEVEQSFAVTVVAKKRNREEEKEFLVATLNTPELLEGLKSNVDDSREFVSRNYSLELTVMCSVKIASSKNPAGLPRAITHDNDNEISHLEKAVKRTPDGHPSELAHLLKLVIALHTRFERLGIPADIDRAVAHNEKAIEFTPEGHPDRPYILSILGVVLRSRFQRLGSLADIDKAVAHNERAVELTPDGHPNKPGRLANLGVALRTRFERLGSLDDIHQAITHNEKAVELTPDGHPSKPGQLNNLGSALQARFERLGSLDDIHQAITHNEKAVELTPDDHPDKLMYLNNLGNALQTRFKRLGNLDDINRAITHSGKAVELTPYDHSRKPICLHNLGNALQMRFERLGSLADIDQAIAHNKKAVELTPDGHPIKPGHLISLGNALRMRFERLGSLADIDQAITHKEKAVELTSDDHSCKPIYLNNLGNALRTRFERLGSLADIHQAISHNKKAVKLTPDGHPAKSSRINSLGNALLMRFKRLGSLADIDEAITHNKKAVELTPDGHPDKSSKLNNIGTALLMRFERLGNLDDIDEAITHNEKAVELTPADHPDKPIYLNNVGNALQSRFERLGSLADIDQAITHNKKAVELTPDGHPDKSPKLNNLSTALLTRFKRLGSLVDIDMAITHNRKAVELTPDGHPLKPMYLNNLGDALQARFDHIGNLEDLKGLFHSYSKASNSLAGLTLNRFNSARRWARAAEKYSRPSLPAYACAINLLPRIAWLGLGVADQHALLAGVGDIVRDAVAAAIQAEEYYTAVEWAEQGRSIVWQNMLGLRTPLDGLRAVHPQLANRLQNITRQLEVSSPEADSGMKVVVPGVDVVRRYSELVTEWEDTVDAIRRLPNFEGFLKPKSFAELAPAAYDGPVVILNVSNLRCDALILIPDDSDDRHILVTSIQLDQFSEEKSRSLFQQLAGLLKSAGVRDRASSKHESGRPSANADEKSKGLFRKLTKLLPSGGVRDMASRKHVWVGASTNDAMKFKNILRILWLDIVKPIMEALACSPHSSNPTRIWWCATGSLAFLPLHAAGLYNAGGADENVSDYVVSSYTPTLTAILDLADPTVRQDFQLLTVAQPSTPYAPPIPMTEEEVNAVQKLAGGVRVMSLKNEDATVKHVLKGMVESNWIHLACHGQQRVDDPMKSGFLLHDRILQLSEIVKTPLPKADFAFLSACQTATGDEKVAEESVHLAAGMLLSGCRGIIATMWSIRDKDGPRVAEDVYTRILKDGRPNRKEAAYALHEAVKRLRESGADFVAWVPFIHIGR